MMGASSRLARGAPALLAVALLAACGASSTTPAPLTPAVATPGRSSAAPASPTPATASPHSPGVHPPPTPAPAGFQVASVTFVSAQDGWVLGTAPCSSGRCLAMARTTDAGATWSSVTPPPTLFSPGQGVSGVRFADLRDGWAYGSQLWATHDGGASWVRVTLPGLRCSGGMTPPIQGLEAAAGMVDAVVCGSSGFAIDSSPVGSNAWTSSPTTVGYGAGPVPSAQLVVQTTSGWVVENDRVVAGGAQLRSGAWAAWTPPCSAVGGPATVAASTPQDLFALCDVGLWTSSSPSERAYVSSDGGARFSPLGARLPSGCQGSSTLAMVSSLVAAAGCGADVVATFDGGASWSTVYTGSGTVRYVGFTTATQGVAIETPASSSVGTLLVTHDGGHSWTPASI